MRAAKQLSERRIQERFSARHRHDPVPDRGRIGHDPTQHLDIQMFGHRRPGVGITMQTLQIAASAGVHLQRGEFAGRPLHEKSSLAT